MRPPQASQREAEVRLNLAVQRLVMFTWGGGIRWTEWGAGLFVSQSETVFVSIDNEQCEVYLVPPGEAADARPSLLNRPEFYGVTRAHALDLSTAIVNSIPTQTPKPPLIKGTVRPRSHILGPGMIKI